MGVFDATTGKLLQTVKAGRNPDAIVYEPVTHRVFAFNGDSSDVTAIDARSLKVLAASIPATGAPEFAVVDGHGRVYFNVEDKNELAILDARTLKIERHYSLAPCEEPSGLAIDPKGRLYSVCRNALMVVSDPDARPRDRPGPDRPRPRRRRVAGRQGLQRQRARRDDQRGGRDGRRTFRDDRHRADGAWRADDRGRPDRHALFSPTADFKPQPASSAAKAAGPRRSPGRSACWS